jgi:hypothetical protein
MSDLNGKLALLSLKEAELLAELEEIHKQQQHICNQKKLYEGLIPELQKWAVNNLKQGYEKEYLIIVLHGDGSGEVGFFDFWNDELPLPIIKSTNQKNVLLNAITNDNT